MALELHTPEITDSTRPVIDVQGDSQADGALVDYLQAVAAELRRRGLETDRLRVFCATPDRALSASMTLHRSSPHASSVYSSRCGDVLCAGWHEELGWWVSSGGLDGLGPWPGLRWLGELAPAPAQAAELLESALRGEGSEGPPPQVLRYRTGERASAEELLRAIG